MNGELASDVIDGLESELVNDLNYVLRVVLTRLNLLETSP